MLALCCPAVSWAQNAPNPSDEPESPNTEGWVDFGVSFVSEFNGQLSLTTAEGRVTPQVEGKLNTGFAVDGGFRQELQPWLGVGVQAGLLYNNLDHLDIQGGGTWTPSATLMQVPVMVDVMFQLPLASQITPFAGGGAGIGISWLSINSRLVTGTGESISIDNSSTELTFAYQAFGGLRFALGANSAVTLTYRWFGTGTPTWSLESSNVGSVGTLQARDLHAQTVTLGFHAGI